ncbi:unnamed protein product [Staphylococcus haemolyticus JCSC1435]|uniref:Uncharacterized protein n=1 Tax=Staphylococcus haemolyticus (strain JCSC1435) TaxID=279808 RepID=Q4L417_STAHJ|nr:unnamed protein product [Staphylococcus haemolyticus JCSC1435]
MVIFVIYLKVNQSIYSYLNLEVMVVIVYSLKARQEETRFTRSKPAYFFNTVLTRI